MIGLSLQQAARIVDAGLDRARELGLKPLTIAVLDAGGHLVAFKRQDQSGILRPEIAQGKAWGALGMGLGGRALAHRAEMAPAFFVSLASVSQGRVVPVPGGVLIRAADNEIVGAVGISGDYPDNDEACAVYGIEQAGLHADPGQAPSVKA
ncbi:MAG: GlcG protein [Nevskia sp.]|nr:GlcG protein [Nevskia sp.]